MSFKTDSVILHNNELEELALVSLVKGQGLVRDYLFGNLRDEHFFTPFGKEIFYRVKNLMKEKNQIPTENSLLGDHAISENSKIIIKNSDFLLNDSYSKTQEEVVTMIEQLSHWTKLRKLHQLHVMAGESLLDTTKDLSGAISSLTNKLYEINTNSDNFENSITRVSDKETIDIIENQILTRRDQQCIPTGFKQFDDVNIGLPRGGLTIIAATTGGGKSLMALTMVGHMAQLGFKTCIVSLEMNEIELLERRFCSVSDIPVQALRTQKDLTIQDKERAMTKYKEYQDRIIKAKGKEDYKCRLNNLSIEELLYGLKPFGYDVIVIDYLGLLKGVDGDDQWRRLSEAARFCKIFAEENNINIIALAQLSKDGEIRYSRGILEHANNSFSWVCDKRAMEAGVIEVEQKKNRTGPPTNFFLEVDFACMRVKDLGGGKRDRYLEKAAAKSEGDQRFSSKKKSFFS